MRNVGGLGVHVLGKRAETPLSEAMVLGSVKHPQKIGGNYDFDRLTNEFTATCGVVAALEAVGAADTLKESAWASVLPSDTFPILAQPATCPCCSSWNEPRMQKVQFVIMHLNDDHHWTRPQQAEWVKGIEAQVANTLQKEVSCEAV